MRSVYFVSSIAVAEYEESFVTRAEEAALVGRSVGAQTMVGIEVERVRQSARRMIRRHEQVIEVLFDAHTRLQPIEHGERTAALRRREITLNALAENVERMIGADMKIGADACEDIGRNIKGGIISRRISGGTNRGRRGRRMNRITTNQLRPK